MGMIRLTEGGFLSYGKPISNNEGHPLKWIHSSSTCSHAHAHQSRSKMLVKLCRMLNREKLHRDHLFEKLCATGRQPVKLSPAENFAFRRIGEFNLHTPAAHS